MFCCKIMKICERKSLSTDFMIITTTKNFSFSMFFLLRIFFHWFPDFLFPITHHHQLRLPRLNDDKHYVVNHKRKLFQRCRQARMSSSEGKKLMTMLEKFMRLRLTSTLTAALILRL